ncbi:SdpI family protein [Rhodanobacter sp. Si-c]|uniref:SdpI family protein n=1 Tax=Rhodanobacter lycopersici TaxID=3162487 RepID=A0ABV3QB19_9GAMM
MKLQRNLWVSVVFVAVAVAAGAWLYPQLPAEVPTHWDLHNHVNGITSRFWAAAFPTLGVLAVAVLSVVLPAASPRQFAIRRFGDVWGVLMLVMQGFVLVASLGMLLAGAGYAVSMPTIVMLATGVLYLLLGNYMGKLRRNFFIGIRTPWTLASDAVWERTHRFGGRLFMLGGLVTVLIALVDPAPWLLLIVLAAMWLIAAGYSYFIHLRLEGSR